MVTSTARATTTPGVELDDSLLNRLSQQAIGRFTSAGDLVIAARGDGGALLLTIEGDRKYDSVTLRIWLDGESAELREIE